MSLGMLVGLKLEQYLDFVLLNVWLLPVQ